MSVLPMLLRRGEGFDFRLSESGILHLNVWQWMECTCQFTITVSFLLERMSQEGPAQHTWSKLLQVSHGHVHSDFGYLQECTLYKLFGQPVLLFVYANNNKALSCD